MNISENRRGMASVDMRADASKARPHLAARPAAAGALRLAYKGRIAAALVALVMASAATLVVPIAVRRDGRFRLFGGGPGLIDAYFAMLMLVVGVLALASAPRYYLVITLGERVVADLRARRLPRT